MAAHRAGYVYAVSAYLLWGLFPLYWRLLLPSTAVEILAHRIVWSAVFVFGIIAVLRSWRTLRTLLRPRTLLRISLAAVLIAFNWGIYIYGVNAERVVETSLGYFINPLVTVLLGVLVLRERLRAAQWVAIGFGAVAVGVLTVDYGHIPVVALALAGTFGLYGLVKKRLQVPAAQGLALESGLLVLPAAGYLAALALTGRSTFGTVSGAHTALLLASGVVTAVPLLLFAGAANRIPLTAIGLIQYLAPTLQFACGVLIFHEPMPPARLLGFGLVWLALAIFTGDGIRRVRAGARATRTTPTPAPVPTGR
ncbi:MAG: EamA family transporter RarD [Micromonosporaceae bacterium]|nr:EamA family transporter RarD [Micromonosporaceae bacterium]